MAAGLRLHRLREHVRPYVPRRLRLVANRLVFSVVGVALMGTGVHCPCCGRSFRRFVRYPTEYCPGCGSYERQRLLCLYLDRNPELAAGDVLHVGPEAAVMRRYRGRARSWLAVDIDPMRPHVDRVMDVTHLSLEDASFDLALCSHVLDVVQDHDAGVRELHRVTRPGGTVLIQAPRRAVPVPGRYVDQLHDLGFREVTAVTLPEQRDEPARRRLGLDDDEPLFVCVR